ncbi:hypothetical protein [Streptomyces sp. NPDC057580]|uniref:hypothetical protein n=1 Tax=Streptomyces sp. NPDC057580 TaxID=3346173 RepID=UPI0036892D0F
MDQEPSTAGVNVRSDETVVEFLLSWHRKKTELKRTTVHEYGRDIELYLVPRLGVLKMRGLRARHAQGVFPGSSPTTRGAWSTAPTSSNRKTYP